MTNEEKALTYFKDLRARKLKDYSSVFDIAPKDSLVYETASAEIEIYNVAIQALEQQPCEDVLKKIRTEILDEAEYAYADFDKYKEDILHAESDELPDDDFRYGMERAVEIIDKYRRGGENNDA